MITLLAFAGAIALLVVFHELGHYWVARRCGVKVLRFSIGFGKAVYSKRFASAGTEWGISAIPLGGYVKMLDEGPPGSPAALAQMQAGETILGINGETIPSWEELRWTLLELALQQDEVK